VTKQFLSLKHERVQCAALSKFVNQHCQKFVWADKALGFIRARNFVGLCELAKQLDAELFDLLGAGDTPPHSSNGDGSDIFRIVSQFVAMVLKYPYSQTQIPGLDPDAAALKELLKDERRNSRLNSIFSCYRVRGVDRHPAHRHMRSVIDRVLGVSPPIKEMLAHCDFSAGASVGFSGNDVHIGRKLSEQITVTPSCVGYFIQAAARNAHLNDVLSARFAKGSRIECVSNDPLRLTESLGLKYVNNNDVCCVPKKYDKSRTIAKEPLGNTFVQKGVDTWMRMQLHKHLGLDLHDQKVNQVMSREGSLGGSDPYVTIDVKSASNSVITGLVRYLCTDEWFSFLNAIRSPCGKLPDGTIHRWALFSSMGNGFTFPLETLIFAAAIIAAHRLCGAPCDYRVYGDDIICRQSVALLVIEVLRSCGFRVNVEKTFIFGPFRESCGANWYRGADVTPVYWRKRITTRSALHAIHNAHHLHPEVQATLRSFDSEMPCVCPNDVAYGWVTDQAFRVPQDVWMIHRGVVWRKDTLSFRYPLLLSHPVRDDEFGPNVPGLIYKAVRSFALFRGSTLGDEFLKRRSTFVSLKRPRHNQLECDVSRFLRSRYAESGWHADDIHAFNLLLKGGMQQRRATTIVRGWAR